MALLDNSTSAPLNARKARQTLAELQPHQAVNERFQLMILATDVPQRAIDFQVAPGLSVRLYGWNGLGNNAQTLTFADRPQQLGTGGQHFLAAGESIECPVNNLGEIWFQGTAGDGLLISVTGVAVG